MVLWGHLDWCGSVMKKKWELTPILKKQDGEIICAKKYRSLGV